MQIVPFSKEYLEQAAALFIQNFHNQRLAIPLLPDLMEGQEHVEAMLSEAFDSSSGLVVLDGGRLVGYLCWFLVDRFRDTDRKGAYVPEWGHTCIEKDKTRLYQALYQSAGRIWHDSGCQVHAITLLSQDQVAEKTWYWNGFGLTVVDIIRPMKLLGIAYQTPFTIRRATAADASALTRLDAEHRQHYAQSPIFMAPRSILNTSENIEYLSRPKNSVWLAEKGKELVGFIRFDGHDFDISRILESEDAVAISGAYVRPEYRGMKAAAAILDSALRDYQSMGLKYCAADFESFNPEAANFWLRYFIPVCYSVVRVPEASS